jgi:hypothetical protein
MEQAEYRMMHDVICDQSRLDHTTLAYSLKKKISRTFISAPISFIYQAFYRQFTTMPRKPRTVFTQEQIDILRQKFAAGMINHYEVGLINEAATETGLSVKTIKVCEII